MPVVRPHVLVGLLFLCVCFGAFFFEDSFYGVVGYLNRVLLVLV